MRVLIVSDTHGRNQNLDRALEAAGTIDLFVHLGDVEGGEFYINAVVPCEKHIVGGIMISSLIFREKKNFISGRRKSLLLMEIIIMFLWDRNRSGKKVWHAVLILLCMDIHIDHIWISRQILRC